VHHRVAAGNGLAIDLQFLASSPVNGSGNARAESQIGFGAVKNRIDIRLRDDVAANDFNFYGCQKCSRHRQYHHHYDRKVELDSET